MRRTNPQVGAAGYTAQILSLLFDQILIEHFLNFFFLVTLADRSVLEAYVSLCM